MTKRILSICLALVLLFGVLAGCSKNEAQTADDTKKTEQSDTEDKTSTQFAYQAQYFDLPEDAPVIRGAREALTKLEIL